jgi:hypothetical protein
MFQDGHILTSLVLHGYSSEPSTSGLAGEPDPGNNGNFTATSFFDVFAEVTLDANTNIFSATGVGSLMESDTSDHLPASSQIQTEMLTLQLSGGTLPPGLEIRESTNPTLVTNSTGQTTVQDIGGGTFQINSFFDVFPEISLDGGTNWSPATGAAVLDSTPEPTVGAMLALGAITVIARRRRAVKS